jgi:hypothetical protein
MDYRQRLVDAAVADLRYQLDPESVAQSGTHVQIEGSFKMARMIEAIMRVAIDPSEAMIEEVARSIAPNSEEWPDYRDMAIDAIAAVRGSILSQLDPLP